MLFFIYCYSSALQANKHSNLIFILHDKIFQVFTEFDGLAHMLLQFLLRCKGAQVQGPIMVLPLQLAAYFLLFS